MKQTAAHVRIVHSATARHAAAMSPTPCSIDHPATGYEARAGAVDAAPFTMPIENYYMTDPISRCSPTMAECTKEFGIGEARTGTHG